MELAGDEMTMPEVAGTFSQVVGREVGYYQLPWNQFVENAGEEATVMYKWFNGHGYEADIAALREEHPGLIAFEDYLRTHDWEGAGMPATG